MRLEFRLMVLFVVWFAGVDASNAAQELPFNRVLFVNEWGNSLDTKTKIDQIINDAVYMNSDAILMYVGSEYFEAERDPVNKGSWDSRASWNLLEYAITKAHENNIQLHVWIPVNIINSPVRAENRLFGTKYNIVYRSGTIHNERTDPAFKELQDYEIGLLTFIAKRYSDLDGIHIEEPWYDTESYSTAMRNRVKAKYGYDPMTKTADEMKPIIRNVARDVFNEFFTKLRASINANKANPDLLLSANGLDGYRSLHGFDPRYMSDNLLLDWYGAQITKTTLSEFKSSVDRLKTEIDDIPVVPFAYITSNSIYPDTNPAFLEQIKRTCEYGGYSEGIFAYHWRNFMVNGASAYNGLHNLRPSSLCGTSTSVVATPTFSASSGTYAGTQTVSISTSTGGATIRYTTDGTAPTESSEIYAAPVIISSSTTLKARAWKTGLTPSAIATATYTIGASAAPPKSGIIYNPGFELGTTSWSFYTNGKGTFLNDASGAGSPHSGHITISQPGTNVQLYQAGLALEPNTRYKLSFRAYSNTGHDLSVSLQKHGSPYTNYGLSNRVFNLGNSWSDHSVEFTTSGFSSVVKDGRLMFWLATYDAASDQYYFDDVVISKVSSSTPSPSPSPVPTSSPSPVPPSSSSFLSNPGFESGTSPWTFYTNGKGTFLNDASGAGSPHAGHITISQPGTNVQLYQAGLALEPNTRYKLSFRAYSNTGHDLSVSLQKHGSPYTNYGLSNRVFNLGTSWSDHSVEFTTSGFSTAVKDGRLMFWLAPYDAASDQYYLDDVVITKISSSTSVPSLSPSPVPSSSPSPVPPSSSSFLSNPGFESGTNSWVFYTSGKGTFAAISPGFEGNNAAKIATSSGGTNIQLYQTGINQEPNTRYRLSFSAYSTTGHDMSVYLHKQDSPYTNYGLSFKADLGTSWKSFTTEFTTTGFKGTVNDGRLRFWFAPFAAAGDTYHIDDIRLEKVI